ncbi:hypothetical protein NHX12_026129, partial [Muraenolepis orangiensis]
MTDAFRQPSLFYHLGVRESFSMANNIILYCDTNSDSLQSLQWAGELLSRELLSREPLSREPLPREPLSREPQAIFAQPCDGRCNGAAVGCQYFRETILNEIRKARELYTGLELAAELSRIQQRLDNVECLSSDIVINLLLSYRDIQDYEAIVKLVETLEKLPTFDPVAHPHVKFHYAFALNRILTACRGEPLISAGRGFESEPTLHSGINYAVLLLAAGHQFDTSFELRKVGVKLSSLLGRKGSLDKLQSYWDVGFFLGASVLASDNTRVIHASEKLFKLKAPIWYLRSLVETILIYQHFKKPTVEQPAPKQELVDFWMDFLVEATKKDVSSLRFPVLILEPTKVYQPSYLSINNDVDDNTVSIWHNKGFHEWNFGATSVRGVSISKFCDLVNSLTDEAWKGPEEGDCEADALEYDYEYDDHGDRVVLGRGTFGVVYSQPLHEEIALHKHLKHKNIVQYLGSISENGFIKIFMEQVPG